MPAAAKTIDNMTKHMTKAEVTARTIAEDAVTPAGFLSPDNPPKSLAKDTAARRYWRRILLDASDTELFTRLDGDVLALYCSMLSRRNCMNKLLVALIGELGQKDESGSIPTSKERLAMFDKLDGLTARAQSSEKLLLSYAKELGLTPSGRAHLAHKRAASEKDDSDELFGD